MFFTDSFIRRVTGVLIVNYLGLLVCPLTSLRAAPAGDLQEPPIVSSVLPEKPDGAKAEILPSNIFKAQRGDNGRTIELSRVFRHPFGSSGQRTAWSQARNGNAGEDDAIQQSLADYQQRARQKGPGRATDSLDNFITNHPTSAYVPAVAMEAAEVLWNSGDWIAAVDRWDRAWQNSKDAPAGNPLAVQEKERAAAALATHLGKLGRKESLRKLLVETTRLNIGGVAASALARAKENLWFFDNDPEHNMFCGFSALNAICVPHGKPVVLPETDTDDKAVKDAYIKDGLSLSRLVAMSNAGGGNMKAWKKVDVSAPWPAPAVVHWKFGHYSAIRNANANGGVVLDDPQMKFLATVSVEVLNREASGYLALPGDLPAPVGCVEVGDAEGSAVFGRCHLHSNGDEGDDCHSGCGGGGEVSTTPSASFSAASANMGMVGHSLNLRLGTLTLTDTPLSSSSLYGDPFALTLTFTQAAAFAADAGSSYFGPNWFTGYGSYISTDYSANWPNTTGTFQPDLAAAWVTDRGTFHLYNSTSQTDSAVGSSYTGQFSSQARLRYFIAGTGPNGANTRITFGDDNTFQDLAVASASGYRVAFPDGSCMDYTIPANSPTTIYLIKRIIDAQGRMQTINYDSQMRIDTVVDATGQTAHFYYSDTVVNPGDEMPSDPRLVRRVADPRDSNRFANFTYNATGRLQSITDTVGIRSEFTYDSQGVSSYTTPYGTTTITGPIGDTTVSTPDGEKERVMSQNYGFSNLPLHVTLADGSSPGDAKGYRLRDWKSPADGTRNLGDVDVQAPASVTVAGTAVPFYPKNDNLEFRNTFHWKKKAMAYAPNDFNEADVYNYAVNDQGVAVQALFCFKPGGQSRTANRGEGRIWYNYLGQNTVDFYVPDTQPAKTVRQVEGPNGVLQWVMTQQTYNLIGLPLVSIDELGRKMQKTYAANNIDVLTEQVATSATAWATLRTYAYPAGTANHHLPLTITELSGKVTTYTYNSKDQVVQVNTSKSTTNSERVRYTYSATATGSASYSGTASGFLRRVERTNPSLATHPTTAPTAGSLDTTGYNAAANWVTTDEFTYDTFNRVATHSDASGYTRTFAYDNLDRLVQITYPDNTTEQFKYERNVAGTSSMGLDVTSTVDRAGRVSRTVYNTNRQPVYQMTPDGKTTSIEWCKCGAISKLTDPLNRVTQWKRDITGRVIEKTMPDGSKHSFTYQPFSGRLSTVTRPNEQGGTPTVNYTYNLDGTLHDETYKNTATPTVTYFYTTTKTGTAQDPLGRLTFVTDGIGTHTFTYNGLTSNLAGAGRVSLVDGPLGNDDHAYGYDWQNRVSLNKVQTDAATPVVTRYDARTWDSLGRPKTVVNLSGTTGIGTFTFGYTTNLNRPDSLIGGSLATAYTYFDNSTGGAKAQRLSKIEHGVGPFGGPYAASHATYAFDYDIAGRLTKMTSYNALDGSYVSGAKASAYGYNLSDEVTSMDQVLAMDPSHTPTDSARWAYDADGNWLSTGSSSMSTRLHDTGNRLTQIGGAGSTVVEGVVNEYSKVQVTSGTNAPKTATMVQDPANNGFRFRAQVPVAEGSNTLKIEATDQGNNLTTKNYQFNTSGLTRSFTYDANGNMLTDSNGRTFTWDLKNRLKSVAVGGNTTRWDYDYLDRRVKEYNYPSNSTTTALNYVNPNKLLIWSGEDLVQERSIAVTGTGVTQTTINTALAAGGTITRTHHFGGFTDGSTGATKYQTTTDHLGNVREVITASGTAAGTVISRYDYSTFQGPTKTYSAPAPAINVDASLLTIGSYYHHAASGLELALYRAYDPALGRWISEDPLEEEGGLNLYGYIGNDPMTKIDSLGLADFPEFTGPGVDLHMHVDGRKGTAYNIVPDAKTGVAACPRKGHTMTPDAAKHLKDSIKDPGMFRQLRDLVANQWQSVRKIDSKKALESLGKGLKKAGKCVLEIDPIMLIMDMIDFDEENYQRHKYDPA